MIFVSVNDKLLHSGNDSAIDKKILCIFLYVCYLASKIFSLLTCIYLFCFVRSNVSHYGKVHTDHKNTFFVAEYKTLQTLRLR